MYIHIYIYIHTHTHTPTLTYIDIHTCLCTHIHACIHAYNTTCKSKCDDSTITLLKSKVCQRTQICAFEIRVTQHQFFVHSKPFESTWSAAPDNQSKVARTPCNFTSGILDISRLWYFQICHWYDHQNFQMMQFPSKEVALNWRKQQCERSVGSCFFTRAGDVADRCNIKSLWQARHSVADKFDMKNKKANGSDHVYGSRIR